MDFDDKTQKLYPENSNKGVAVEELKAVFVTEDITLEDLAFRYGLTVNQLVVFAEADRWLELRKAYIKAGLSKIQSSQIQQAEKLLSLENGFKKLKLIQLEEQLEKYAAHFAKYGHLYMVYLDTGELMLDHNNMPIPINIPNVRKEVKALKESFNVGEGLNTILDRLEKLMLTDGSTKKAVEAPSMEKIVETEYSELFNEKKEEER